MRRLGKSLRERDGEATLVPEGATKPERPFLTLALLAALCASAWQIQAALPLNHDVAWLLIGARRLLDAGRLAADRFVDVTPPLVLGLYALPVAVSRAVGISEIAALRIFVIGLAAGSLALCQLAAARLSRTQPAAWVRTWLVILAIVLLPLVGYDFGQREHLITLLLLPYLVEAAARACADTPPRSLAIWTGAAAGLAIGIKPQFALVVIGAEAIVWQSRKQWRAVLGPPLGAFATTVVLCAIWTAWQAPDYLRVTLPLALEAYTAYREPLGSLVRWLDATGAAALLAIAWLLPRGSALRELARTLVAAAAAAYAVYLAAGSSWDYHRYPFVVFAVATLALPLLRPLSRGPVAAGLALAVAIPSIFVAPLDLRQSRRADRDWSSWSQGAATLEILRAVEQRGSGGSIFLFSSSLVPAFPAVNYAGVEWASRFSCLWLLPAVIRAQALPEGAIPEARRQRLGAIERYLVDAVTDDLERARPDLILVPRGRRHQAFGGVDFDFLPFFERDPRFAKLWSDYSPVEETKLFRIYRLRQP